MGDRDDDFDVFDKVEEKKNDNKGDVNNDEFLRECRKIAKKARDFQVRKTFRKSKKGEGDPEKIQKDVEILKNFDMDFLAKAIIRTSNKEKAFPKPQELEQRHRDLALLLVNSNTVKKFLVEYKAKAKKKQRKKQKKLKSEELRKQKKELMKKSDKRNKSKTVESSTLKGIRIGQKMRGIVDGAEPYGVFVKFVYKKRIISGLCHISELANRFIKDPKKEFPIGTWVNSEVLALDKEHNRLKLRLKGLNGDKSSLQRARLKESKLNGNVKEPTSEFLGSLADSRPKEGNVSESKAVMSLLKKVQKSSKGKNRLGQRERKRLQQILYGGEDEQEQPRPIKKPRRNSKVEIKKEEEKEENLHPSWAAKRKASKVVAFQGTRITFD